MALTKREKNLAVVTAVLASVAGVWFAFMTLSGPLFTLRGRRAELQDEVYSKNRLVQAAWKAQKQLDDYRRRSLPSDPEIARSLYKNWLLELAKTSGLEDTRFDPGETRLNRDIYRALPFSIHGKGTLDELTKFLFGFYSKGYLQKIRQLTMKPLEGSRNLDLTITIEALSLPGAEHADKLPHEPSLRLAAAELADYASIGQRNLFAPYQPPPPVVAREEPVRREEPPRFDPSKFAFITGIVEENGQPQLWLKARTTGKTFRLCEGDTFELGPVQGKVVQIHPRAAEIEIDGQRRLIPLGNSLSESKGMAN